MRTKLKGNYHYEGNFSDILEMYCKEYDTYDENDESEYYNDQPFVTYLQKLRKCRNNIVHPNKTEDTMLSNESIKFRIVYICKLK